MATITITDALGTGFDPVFAAVRTLEIEDQPFGEGAFGKVHRCSSVNGSQLPRTQALKLLLDDGSGSHERGLRTIRKLQERLGRKIQASGLDSIINVGALAALPQFSFRGELNGKPVLGYAAHLLAGDWIEFGRLFNDPDPSERKRLRDRFYNLPLEARMRIAHELVEGFSLLRELGFIYADLNPKNFFVDMDRARLCLIDYEGGAINEDPETFGKMGEWLAPEIQSQLMQTGSGKVKVDLSTDTWAVAIGVHFMLFPFHPVFFLAQRGEDDMRRYFTKNAWPDVDTSNPNFREQKTYDWYRKKLNNLPSELVKAFAETVNQGWNNRNRRLSYTQWERAIAAGMRPPEVMSFTVQPTAILPGIDAVLSWSVDRAISIEIDNGVGDVTGKTEITVKPQARTQYTLRVTGHFGAATATTEVVVFPIPIIESLRVPSPDINAFVSLKPVHISAPEIDLSTRFERERLTEAPTAFSTLRDSIQTTRPMHGKAAEPGTISMTFELIQRMIKAWSSDS